MLFLTKPLATIKNKNMKNKINFEIDCLCDEIEYRPRVSCKIRYYIFDFVMKQIVFPKKIMLSDKYDYFVAFILIPCTKNEENDLVIWDKWKLYGKEKTLHISIFNHSINANATPVEYALMLYEALKEQFVRLYKKIKAEDFDKVKSKLDYDFINSFSYPAPFNEQKYTFDNNAQYENEYVALYGNEKTGC